MICHGCGRTTDSKYPFGDPRNHAPECPAGQPKDPKNKLGKMPNPKPWIPRHDTYFDEDY